MFRKQYDFCGIGVRVEADRQLEQLACIRKFAAPLASADLTFTYQETDVLPVCPPGAQRWVYGETRFQNLWRMGGGDAPGQRYACVQRMDHHVLFQSKRSETKEMGVCGLLDQAGLQPLLLEFRALLLHAVYLLYQGEAILFTAPSGTGKTTQAELWCEHRGGRIINGDRTLLRRTEAGFLAGGFYISGTSKICMNHTAPVRAIVILDQGTENYAGRLHAAATVERLLSQASYDVEDPENVRLAVQFALDAAAELPVVHLTCTPDIRAIEALERYLNSNRI